MTVVCNSNNTINFGEFKGIAEDIECFTISAIDNGAAAVDLTNETNPGEALEAIIETIQLKTTILAIGAQAAGVFRVMVHGGAWDAADLQTAIRALGATVGTNNVDLRGSTAVDFTF